MATHLGARLLDRLASALRLRDDSQTHPGLLNRQIEMYSRVTIAIGLCVAIFYGALIVLHPQRGATGWMTARAESLYLASLGALVLFRFSNDLRVLWASYALCLASTLGLSVVIDGGASSALLMALAFFIVLRMPLRWSLPALAPALALSVSIEGVVSTFERSGFTVGLWALLATYTLVVFGGFATRSRAFTLKDLRETQTRLRAEMTRNERLAVARERARIARDMHDLLAHSLTLLSVQTQAVRQLMRQDPERAANMLDEMAVLVRESAAESRRVVGVLREASAVESDSPLVERLRALAERFGERTGAMVSVVEEGAPQPLDETREATLRFALQEALTNAYRHGGAQHVWVTLRWQPSGITLDMRDDGDAGHAPTNLLGGGNGLRGMRERAEALGGTLMSGPHADGGYRATLTLPLAGAKSASVRAAPLIQEAV